jgi:TRAP-type C4-dicarboxylate transport system substrate-binding protein
MKLRANRNPVAKATLKALKGSDKDIHICEIEDLTDHVATGKCDGGETTYSRVYPLKQNEVIESVVDTKHSLFLTSMIMRENFWKTLSPEVQAVIKDAAIKAGRNERQATIEDGEEAKKRLIEEGVNIHELTPEEKADWEEKTKKVYEKFEPTFTKGLINDIKKS